MFNEFVYLFYFSISQSSSQYTFHFQNSQNESRWADCWCQGRHTAKHLALLGSLPFDGPSSFSPLLSWHGFSLYEASLPQKKPGDDAADETALPIAHHRRGWCPFLTSTSTPPQNPSPIQAVWYWIPNKTAHNSELDGWLRWNAFHIEIVLIFEMNFGMTVCGPRLQSIIIAFLNWNYAILNLHMLP